MNRETLNVEAEVRKQFETIGPRNKPYIFIGFSGGLDSLALLVALVRVVGDRHKLICLHADHGHSSHSADWAAHCEKICKSLSVQLIVEKLEITGRRNLEREFREKRYRFLRKYKGKKGLLVLGHHLNDQVETVLIRLFKGEGYSPCLTRAKRWSYDISAPYQLG